MITDPKTADYLDLLDPGNSAFAEELRAEAVRDGVPVIRRNTEGLLKAVIAMTRPEEILEVGTGAGYSAVVMAENMPPGCRLTTIENYAPRIATARENFERAAVGGSISFLTGDAGGYLASFEAERFGLIFLDAAKGQYLNWLPDLLRILKPGGVLFSDNVLQEGSVAESRFAVDRRDRTIHARMREYLYRLTHTEGLTTSVVPSGDGAALTVKGSFYHEKQEA